VVLQLIDNKALSWGIIGKSALVLAEITIRKSQGVSCGSPRYGFKEVGDLSSPEMYYILHRKILQHNIYFGEYNSDRRWL
jgi:hypothetical protein